MNTMKTVMAKVAKIETEKVELASERVDLEMHRVELALADELKTYVKNASQITAKYAKQKALIVKNVQTLNEASKDLILNKDYGKKVLASAAKFKAQFDKLSKDLGVSLAGSEPDKLLSEVFMLGEDAQGHIDDAITALKSIKS